MTKAAIIERLYLSKNFNDCISKMHPDHLRDDLRAEVIAEVCEWPAEKIIGLYQRGQLDFYVVRVMLNMLTNKNSKFFKGFRQQHDELNGYEQAENLNFAEQKEHNQTLQAIINTVDKLYWYDAAMVKLYAQLGNYRAMQAHTQIPYTSCHKTVKRGIAALKKLAHEKIL